MSLVDPPPVITEAMQAAQTRELNASLDKLAATALRIRDERDEMAHMLRKALRQLDRYREALIEAENDLAGIDADLVRTRIHLALHERPYVGSDARAVLAKARL